MLPALTVNELYMWKISVFPVIGNPIYNSYLYDYYSPIPICDKQM